MASKILDINGLTHLWGKLKSIFDTKADKATTLAGYGITDAKIADGVITLGEATITPLVEHQSLDGVVPITRKVNDKALSADITLTYSDVGAAPEVHDHNTVYYTKTEIDGKLTGAFHYKGTKSTFAALPTEGNEVGDVWNIETADVENDIKAGDNVAWTGTAWDVLSGVVDLSAYMKTADLVMITNDEIDGVIAANPVA